MKTQRLVTKGAESAQAELSAAMNNLDALRNLTDGMTHVKPEDRQEVNRDQLHQAYTHIQEAMYWLQAIRENE